MEQEALGRVSVEAKQMEVQFMARKMGGQKEIIVETKLVFYLKVVIQEH